MMPRRSAQCLQAMGITRWLRRDAPAEVAEKSLTQALATDAEVLAEAPSAPYKPARVQTVAARADTHYDTVVAPTQPSLNALQQADWQQLRQQVSVCTACALAQGRTKTVFGVGHEQADWLIIGEAPGEQEDLRGEPFVGRAGLLLTNMLNAVGLERESVYIANVVKCRPPKNRDPLPGEVQACSAYLVRQIELLKPKLMLVVGRVAAQRLLETNEPVGRLRGRLHRYPGSEIPLIVTYHPAFLLRQPKEKRKAWDDLKLALKVWRDERESI